MKSINLDIQMTINTEKDDESVQTMLHEWFSCFPEDATYSVSSGIDSNRLDPVSE